MALRPMHDLIIFLPGIMGSLLVKDGKALWGLAALPRTLQFERLIRDLTLAGDDAEQPSLGDGVVATELMPAAQLIPGFWKIDGYTTLIDAIQHQFAVTVGSIHTPQANANFFPFPYDWRRDNRANARRLATFIEQQIRVWRTTSGNPNAKVILIAHSMGGLIARYYLECLGGAAECRVLMTFGTPYRGSLDALNTLANGLRVGSLDVSSALRSFTSVYQLLPTYPVIQSRDTYLTVSDVAQIANLDRSRAHAALVDFHQPMEDCARARSRANLPLPYQSFLLIGTNQPTKQSAILTGDAVALSNTLPEPVRKRDMPGFGDNTVPFYAALPGGTRITDHALHFGVECHSSLQCNLHLLQQLLETLHLLQADQAVLGMGSAPSDTQPGLRLLLDAAYPPEGGVIRVEPVQLAAEPGDLRVSITPLAPQRPPDEQQVPFANGAWHIELDRPTPGIYRINAALQRIGSGGSHPIQDLFEVVE